MSLENKLNYVEWLKQYDWKWFATLTIRNGIWSKTANRLFREWISRLQAAQPEPISWFRVAEFSPKNHRLHFHVFIAGLHPSNLSRAEALWRRTAGIAEIQPYDPNRRALPYSLKSIEDSSDFDFDVQLNDEHLRANPLSKTISTSPPNSAHTDDFSGYLAGDETVPQSIPATSDFAEHVGNKNCNGQEQADGKATLPSPRRTKTRLSREDSLAARLVPFGEG